MTIAGGVSPTRTELKALRESRELTEAGHSILKDKNEALVLELWKTRKALAAEQERMGSAMSHAFSRLRLAQARLGHSAVKYLARSVRPAADIRLDERRIMGVPVRLVRHKGFERRLDERGYSLADSSATLDDAAFGFEKAAPLVLSVGEKEDNKKLLAREAEKTRRKVSALENYVLPGLARGEKYIVEKLAEREREDFVRVKKVKKIIGR